MASNAINPAKNPPISGRKQKNLTDPAEIVHIDDKAKKGRTLCGIKGRYWTKAKPDCVVCLDLAEVRRN